MFDLKITGGRIVDGTGAPAYLGEVAIKDGKIAAIGASVPGEAAQTIDATGRIVTPGFVDIHTHYDGQVTWDDNLDPSGGHGVTTVVMGNCGVGFAPVKPGKEEWLIQLMEGVEDIPGTALSEGITWEWESFPEYLDALEKRKTSVDFGTQLAHGALRAYVMGERGAKNEPATPEDIAQMRELTRQAIEAGALGVSTSRVLGHRAMDGEPVPGTFAAEDELFGLGYALRDAGAGVFELAPAGADGQDLVNAKREVEWMKKLSAEIERPVTFAMLQNETEPGALARDHDGVDRGGGAGRAALSPDRGAALRPDDRPADPPRLRAPSHLRAPARGDGLARGAGRRDARAGQQAGDPVRGEPAARIPATSSTASPT